MSSPTTTAPEATQHWQRQPAHSAPVNPQKPPRMTRGLMLLFAVATGAAVGNLYWAQPLLALIARNLHVSSASAGLLVTLTQIGYAAGILLIVPLSDVRNRRRLLLTVMLGATTALVLCALAPSFGVLLAAITALGLTTVGGQILLPLAGDLAEDDKRGRVIGTVASGALTGILVSRTLSGVLAGAAGWRLVYALAAAADLLLAILLYRILPSLPPKARLRYPALIASVAAIVLRERTARWTLLLSATAFGLFTMFWTALTLLLSGPAFEYSTTTIGLFGLAGVAGAVAAQRAGRLHDRGWSLPATGAAWALVPVSFLVAARAGHSVGLLIVAIVALDVAIQAINILNQTRIFAISAEERSRLNTALVTTNFIGGALGSAVAAALWTAGGWGAVTTAAAAASCFAFAVWAVGRRGPLVIGPSKSNPPSSADSVPRLTDTLEST